QTCAELVGELDRVFQQYEPLLWQDALKSDTRAYAADRVSPAVHRFFDHPLLNKISSHYVKDLQCFFTLANRVRVVPGNLGSGGGWHRDTPWERQFKALVYLVDVGPKNGAFEYLPRSHHVSFMTRTIASCGIRLGQNRLSEEEIARIVQRTGVAPVRLTAPAGTLILTDSSGIHRGSPIEEGERYAMTNYYFEADTIKELTAKGKFTGYFVDRSPSSAQPQTSEML
ncbi:MAG: phytanoyl-CoA dioxygenase family protein, partial [Pirellulales bacterium]